MNAKFLFEPLKTYFISHFALAFVTHPFIPSILPKQTSSNFLPSLFTVKTLLSMMLYKTL